MTPSKKDPRKIIAAIAALIAVVAGGGTLVITADPADDRVPPAAITVTVPAPKPAALPLVPKPEDAHVEPGAVAAPAADEQHIPGKTEAQENQIRAENTATIDEQTYDTSGVLKGAAAEPARIKCPTTMHGQARPMSAIGLGVVHVTVSRNAPGLRDINGLCDFFKRVKASPTWTVDNEGNSAENVALGLTPWTQAFYNRQSCSIEFVGSTGRPGEGPAEWTDDQYREGARLMARCFKLAGIPVRRGAVTDGGKILRTGVVTHQELGRLGGGHSDPGERFDMARFMQLVRVFAGSASPLDRQTCRKLNWWRNAGRPQGKPQANASRRKRALAARGVTCLPTGPVKAV